MAVPTGVCRKRIYGHYRDMDGHPCNRPIYDGTGLCGLHTKAAARAAARDAERRALYAEAAEIRAQARLAAAVRKASF